VSLDDLALPGGQARDGGDASSQRDFLSCSRHPVFRTRNLEISLRVVPNIFRPSKRVVFCDQVLE
jgi:hypothetical protein